MKKRILDTFLDKEDYHLLKETGTTTSIFNRTMNKYLCGLIISFVFFVFGIGRFIYKLEVNSNATSDIRILFSDVFRFYYLIEFLFITTNALVIFAVFLKDFKSSIKRVLVDLKYKYENGVYDKSRN